MVQRGSARESVNGDVCVAQPWEDVIFRTVTREQMIGSFRNGFLAQVLRRDRLLGRFFIAFAVVQLVAQLLTAEVTPFFLYGMYSERTHPLPTYVRVTCQVDDAQLTQAEMPRFAGELFFSTLYRLDRLDAKNYQDLFGPFIEERFGWLPDRTKEFPAERLSFDPKEKPALGRWMIRYLERVLGEPVHTVRIDREVYRYTDHRPVLVERTNLLTAHAPANVHH